MGLPAAWGDERELSMAFVRLRGKRWYLCYRDAAGVARQEPSKARTKTEAKLLADEMERKEWRIRKGLDNETPLSMTWLELDALYLRDVVPNHESAKTTESQMKHLRAALGKKLLHQIIPADIERVMTAMRETHSEATREKVRKRAQTMFRYAKESLRVFRGENPAALAKRIRPAVKRPKYLPADLVPRVLAAAGRDEDLLAVAFFTGLRKGELCGIRPEDVNLPLRTIHVRRSYSKGTTKGRREREVYVPDLLAPYLERALQVAHDEGHEWLFPDVEGKQRTLHWDAANTFRQCLKAAGLIQGYRHVCRRKGCGFEEMRKDDAISRCPTCEFVLLPVAVPMAFTFKHTRSTWGTHAYAATGDIRFVQQGLGHTDVSVTEAHYSHALREQQLRQANKLVFDVRPPVRRLPQSTDEVEPTAPTKAEATGTKTEGNR